MGKLMRCVNYENCPVFTGVLNGMEVTVKNYKKLYCEAGEQGWSKCKRYQVKAKTGKCPPALLPNSTKTLEEIIASMK